LAHPGNGSVRSVLTHGDFQSSNILIDDRGQLSLIDFTLSRRSSPAADLATLLIHTDAMTRGRIPEAPRRALLQSAVRAYLKASPAWRRRTTLDDLPGRLAESILDVCAITLESYGARDRNARSLVSHLLALDVTNAYV
jgi:aminoglycoside phosphotransferase (APT) family kinase protein